MRLQIVASSPAPPDGEGWLHEIKHDGHRLVAIVGGGGCLSLISRNGYDRTEAFGAPFPPLASAGHELVIDGEIAVPDDRGVTHLDFLNDAIARQETIENITARARVYEAQNDSEKAEADYRRATELKPRSVFEALAQNTARQKAQQLSKPIPCANMSGSGTCL